ncbi:DSD1 family PLP-dependent enzyme [Roseospira visakhapatnamensis]|uniref:3-hydroxy-D-aspartate aldolase n=1 Tax=Roseospira visakhapatnamensis TaxID=390880 RepID=A0A7W6WBC1_9PROT|nr:DSD1 family PLP-dependent enzyme [Roseospira visakhapatnamensis]MBB4267351.1 3-hydroxy-D-aspartate aldolase [Roseospira visakhapatnamensis]
MSIRSQRLESLRWTVGVDVPAVAGMGVDEICTPALVVDLTAFEANVRAMKGFAAAHGMALRAHAKTHKSADIALIQMVEGGARGVCCQKVSEAEALVAGGVRDVLVSNQVVDARRVDRLAALAQRARVAVCVDDADAIGPLSAAAARHRVMLEVLVEIDVGNGRCGVAPGAPAVELARRVANAPALRFVGLQAYQGAAQHIYGHDARRAAIAASVALVRETVAAITETGMRCPVVSGGGTGTWPFEAESGVYTELQCGSYIFMDADYRRVREADGRGLPAFAHSLFVLTSVMSRARPGHAVCDAGLKVLSVDSGLPTVFDRDDVTYAVASDEHGTLVDAEDRLRLNDRLWLVPGHCDPTCNLHDWYVAVRDGVVEALWPVTARGKAW